MMPMDNILPRNADMSVPYKRLVICHTFAKSGRRIGIAIGINTAKRTFAAGFLWREFGWPILELTEKHDLIQVGPFFAGMRTYNKVSDTTNTQK